MPDQTEQPEKCWRCEGSGFAVHGFLACPVCYGTGVQPTLDELRDAETWMHDPDMEDR